jgi:hypothetical protein
MMMTPVDDGKRPILLLLKLTSAKKQTNHTMRNAAMNQVIRKSFF